MPPPGITALRIAELLGPGNPAVPAYRWLADGLQLLIVDGRIPGGHTLPSERRLTQELALSRTTVTRAYSILVDGGFLRPRRGSGYVATLPTGTHHLGVGGALLPGAEVGEDFLDLTCAASRAPAGTAEAYATALTKLPSYLAGTGYATGGLLELRELIATRYAERGLPTSPDQILVVSGALSGVSLAVRALTSPGQAVLVETPSYPNSIEAVRRAGARLIPLPVEPTGWDLELATANITMTKPAAAVMILDFHNPTGSLMSDPDRAKLAAAFKKVATVPIVDETVLEVRLDEVATPLPFAAHLSRCVLIGSSSKSHWGGLRTGWLRVPTSLLPRMLQARIADDLGAPFLEQLVLIELLKHNPGLDPGRRDELRTARQAMIEALPEAIPQARWTRPSGGLSLWVELPQPRASQLAISAHEFGLLISPGPQFAVGHGLERFIRLPYKDPAEVVTEAMRRLGQAWLAPQGRTASPQRQPPRPVVA